MPRLLVIDDDVVVGELVKAYGNTMGWVVEAVADAAAGLQAFRTHPPDVVVLDLMLPDASGWTVLEAIRSGASDAYVLVLTARADEADRIGGFARGADDYVVKPFSPGELMARCQALLRRPRASGSAAAPPLAHGGLALDPDTYEARLDGARLELSALEFQLLMSLMRRPGRVFTRDQLADAVWGQTEVGAGRVVDVHIGRLRRKLGEAAESPRFIETIRGVGYRLRAQPGPP